MATKTLRTRITYSWEELHEALKLVPSEKVVWAMACDDGGLVVETERMDEGVRHGN